MAFHSVSFLFFFPILCLIYWNLPKKFQTLFLLFSSFAFILLGAPIHAVFLLGTTIICFFVAKQIKEDQKSNQIYLFIGLLFLFGQLAVFKYLSFFEQELATVFPNLAFSWHLPAYLIPIGLSFYTFQIAGYLIDVYRKSASVEKSFIRFATFVSFFPILQAGPIERGNHLLPQFNHAHRFNYQEVVSGLKLFSWGLFKKLVIADNLAVTVNLVFNSLENFRGLSLLLTMIFFSWQLYADFSGYTDMARGIGRMLGFDILPNFNVPYLATSIQDFWRRWHMSLSSWFREYLYIPLGGNRHGKLRAALNTLIVFTICGLWHGAAITFVIWGMIHGIAITVERVVKSVFKTTLHLSAILSTMITYTFVTFAWIFFRSPTLKDSLYIVKNCLVGVGNIRHLSYIQASFSQLFMTNTIELGIAIGGIVFLFTAEILQSRYQFLTLFNRLPREIRLVLYAVFVSSILMLRNAQVQQFIYVQF